MSSCVNSSDLLDFVFNGALHAVILLCIVSAFFFLYISKLSQSIFEKEIGGIIEDNLVGMLNQVNIKTNGVTKNTLKSISSWDKILKHYQGRKDTTIQTQNKWLKIITGLCVVFLIIFIVSIILTTRFSCNICIPWVHILLENIVLFLGVGVIEIGFFMFIASKFVPSPPSHMMESIFHSIHDNL